MLPAATQTLLLAAAEPSGSAALLWRAADRLGLGAEAAVAAEADGLLTIAEQITFRHPLVRSAVYHGARLKERQRVHGTLAAVVDARMDAEGRAWHLAAAATGPDERVAGELARSSARAHSRGSDRRRAHPGAGPARAGDLRAERAAHPRPGSAPAWRNPGADLTGVTLDGAQVDAHMVWPEGFDPGTHRLVMVTDDERLRYRRRYQDRPPQ